MFSRRPCKISLFFLKACRMVWRVTKKSSYTRRFKSSFSCAAKEPLLNEADAMGIFLTVFAVLSLESLGAETLVVVLFVQWQTFTFVLARPSTTGCLSKECIVHNYSRSYSFVLIETRLWRVQTTIFRHIYIVS